MVLCASQINFVGVSITIVFISTKYIMYDLNEELCVLSFKLVLINTLMLFIGIKKENKMIRLYSLVSLVAQKVCIFFDFMKFK